MIASWTTADWWDAPGRVGDLIAPIIGAAPGTVTVADSTSVNLFKTVVAAILMQTNGPDRRVIVVNANTFPTDRYIVDEAARLFGLEIRPVDPADASALAETIAATNSVAPSTPPPVPLRYPSPSVLPSAHTGS